MFEVVLTGLIDMALDPWKLVLFGIVLAGLLIAVNTKEKKVWGLAVAFIFFGFLSFLIKDSPALSDRLVTGLYYISQFLSWGVNISDKLSFTISDLVILATAAMQVSGAEPVDSLMNNIRSILTAVIVIMAILVFL
jgi:hypothetical protein